VGDEGLYVNQYVGGTVTATVDGTEVTIAQDAAFPWDGSVSIDVQTATTSTFALRLRVPGWAEGVTITVDGEPIPADSDDGYVSIERAWDDDQITAEFELSTQALTAHPAVEADAGRLALQRGPIVYCLEGVDHDRPLHHYAVDPVAAFEATYHEDLLEGVCTLEGEATVPARDGWEGELYRPATETTTTTASISAVPYYAWDNRGPTEMRVWLRSA
ncbi:MAG: glycoside hydrolase family 127 protein, partial [Halorhabdus sp.]